MDQKRVWIGFLVSFFLLVGTSSALAAFWDQQCRVAIEDVQRLQQEITVKKQEVDAARLVQAIPSNFVSGQLEESIRFNDGSRVLNELKSLFQNMEFAVSKFSTSCLKSNRGQQ